MFLMSSFCVTQKPAYGMHSVIMLVYVTFLNFAMRSSWAEGQIWEVDGGIGSWMYNGGRPLIPDTLAQHSWESPESYRSVAAGDAELGPCGRWMK